MGLQVLLSTAFAIPTSHLNDVCFGWNLVCPFESFGVGNGSCGMNRFWVLTQASGLTPSLTTDFIGEAL